MTQEPSLLQQLWDNWTLVYLFTAFVGIVLWVVLGKAKAYRDTSEIIFRHDDKPAQELVSTETGSKQG
ncbi:MAG: cbb3-type cytochrome oxidase subunit 3 [Mangrovicoccus sp.]